ncbi:uncharacterized protein METZ01_LOCUS110041, partial [marine metagenome]
VDKLTPHPRKVGGLLRHLAGMTEESYHRAIRSNLYGLAGSAPTPDPPPKGFREPPTPPGSLRPQAWER